MKVNMLIIGAGRSGTTSLYEYLKMHQDICFSNIKEVPFFSIPDIYSRGTSYYHSFFKPDNQKVIASSDTYLLIDKEAPKRILNYNPNMKIIVMLREPVERAYSSYIYAINNGHEKKGITFTESFQNEEKNISDADIITKNNLGHFYTGLYYKHIQYWMQFFPKENFFLIKTNDLRNNHQNVLNKVSSFLNIENFNITPEIKANKAAGVKFMFLHKLLIDRNTKLRKILRRVSPSFVKERIFNSGIIERIKHLNNKNADYKPISTEEKNYVKSYFEDDLKLLKKKFDIKL